MKSKKHTLLAMAFVASSTLFAQHSGNVNQEDLSKKRPVAITIIKIRINIIIVMCLPFKLRIVMIMKW